MPQDQIRAERSQLARHGAVPILEEARWAGELDYFFFEEGAHGFSEAAEKS
jgi:hypothetical protein